VIVVRAGFVTLLEGRVILLKGMVRPRQGMVTRLLLGRFIPWTRDEAENAELDRAEDARDLEVRVASMAAHAAAGTRLGSSHSDPSFLIEPSARAPRRHGRNGPSLAATHKVVAKER
jgi:hypothetical protein